MSTVLVTGSNRGIGLQLCKQLSRRGDTVIGVCRTASAELNGPGIEVIADIDVSRQADVAALAAQLAGRPLDVVISNAGILLRDSFDSIDFEQMSEQFRVNTLGPLRVIRALRDNLGNGSKVAIVSSRVGSIADNGSGGNYGYRVSKAAVNMVGMNLSHDLAPHGIAVALLHPGLVATDMTGGAGVSPEDAAAGLIRRIDELDLDGTGSFQHAEGYELPW